MDTALLLIRKKAGANLKFTEIPTNFEQMMLERNPSNTSSLILNSAGGNIDSHVIGRGSDNKGVLIKYLGDGQFKIVSDPKYNVTRLSFGNGELVASAVASNFTNIRKTIASDDIITTDQFQLNVSTTDASTAIIPGWYIRRCVTVYSGSVRYPLGRGASLASYGFPYRTSLTNDKTWIANGSTEFSAIFAFTWDETYEIKLTNPVIQVIKSVDQDQILTQVGTYTLDGGTTAGVVYDDSVGYFYTGNGSFVKVAKGGTYATYRNPDYSKLGGYACLVMKDGNVYAFHNKGVAVLSGTKVSFTLYPPDVVILYQVFKSGDKYFALYKTTTTMKLAELKF